MSLIAILTASAVDSGAMRVTLFIMVLVAVVLILVGSVVALMALYNQRKNQTADRTFME